MQYCYRSPWIGKTFVISLVLLHPCIFVSNILMITVTTLTKLMLLAPAANAVWKSSFFYLKRLKTYLRSTMGDDRLFHLMVLHVHMHVTASLDLIQVANRFIATNNGKKQCSEHLANVTCQWKKFLCQNSTQTVSKNNMLLLSVNCKLTFIKFLSFIIPASVWEVQLQLQFYVHCNFIWIFGHYLHVNHSQHDFYKPLSQVLPQKTSLKSLSEIHFKAVLEGLDFKIFFNSFLDKLFTIAESVPHLEFWPSYDPVQWGGVVLISYTDLSFHYTFHTRSFF